MHFRKGARDLRGVKGFLELLRRLALSPEKSTQEIESIRKEAKRD
jgi:hypothetical protein